MAVVVKNLPPNTGGLRDTGLIPGSGGSPEGEHVQCSCLENPHGQRSLAGYSLSGRKESDMTGRLSTHAYSMEPLMKKKVHTYLFIQKLII